MHESPITACDNAIEHYQERAQQYYELAGQHRKNMEDAENSEKTMRAKLIEWEKAKATLTGDSCEMSPTGETLHQKSEGCWCGAHISAEGDEKSVLFVCSDFRFQHAHRQPDDA
jgi:hypothetical protein